MPDSSDRWSDFLSRGAMDAAADLGRRATVRLMPGTRLGTYEIKSLLGKGGIGKSIAREMRTRARSRNQDLRPATSGPGPTNVKLAFVTPDGTRLYQKVPPAPMVSAGFANGSIAWSPDGKTVAITIADGQHGSEVNRCCANSRRDAPIEAAHFRANRGAATMSAPASRTSTPQGRLDSFGSR